MKRLCLSCALLAPALAHLGCSGNLAVAMNGPEDSGGFGAEAGSSPTAPDANTSSPGPIELNPFAPDGTTSDGPHDATIPYEAGQPTFVDAMSGSADAGWVPPMDPAGGALCYGVGPAQQVVTLEDVGGQWVTGCDPSAPVLAAVVSGPANSDQGVPANTVGFEFEPSTHHAYPLIVADGGYERATGPGAVWWVNDIYSYGALPNGRPQEYLSISNANLYDGGSYSELLGGWGVLYHSGRDSGLPSLTLVDFGGNYNVPMVPPAALPADKQP